MENNSSDMQLPIQSQEDVVDAFVIETQENDTDIKFLTFSGITIFFLTIFFGAIVIFILSSKPTMPKHILIPPTTKVSATVVPTQSLEVTQYTKIATSLTVPPLYKNWQWHKESTLPMTDSLRSLTVDRFDQKYLQIPFPQGEVYKATLSAINNPDSNYINNYYAIQLQKLGWLISEKSSYLVFNSFRVRTTSVSGICKGMNSYLGYKDEMVRMVSIGYEMLPCVPPTDLLNGAIITRNIVHTVFISDPVPLQYFNEYMSSHAK